MTSDRRLLIVLSFATLLPAENDCKPQAPCYTAASIVNSASSRPESFAPYAFATIYGTELSHSTRGRTSADSLPSLGGVNVLVNSIPAIVFYVSPGQVNLLIPSALLPGRATVQLTREGTAGPAVELRLDDCAPALFQLDPETVVALSYPGWEVATQEVPLRPGEYAILYATGLGPPAKRIGDYEAPQAAIPIERRHEFKVLLNGIPVPDSRIEYAGVVPTYFGLYQINLKLPEETPANPELRIVLGGHVSPPGLYLPVTAGPRNLYVPARVQ